MKKLNHKLLFYIFPFLVVISIICKPSLSKSFSIQSQTQNYKISPSPNANPVPSQASLKAANTNTDVWGRFGAIGSLLSGIIAVLAFLQSWKNKDITDTSISSLIDVLKNQTNDPNKKQEFLDIQTKFFQESKEISDDERADKDAKKWLKKNMEGLADRALNTILIGENFSEQDRNKFRCNLLEYLSAIQKDLSIGDYDHMDQKAEELSYLNSRDNELYKKSLKIIIEKAKQSNLSHDSKDQLKLYVEHLINNIV